MMPLLSVEHLSVDFHSKHGVVRAVDDISFSVDEAETVALVGESGSGKSITALSVMRLLPHAAKLDEKSRVFCNEQALLRLSEIEMRHIRGRQIGMIFQEAMTALNPVLTIGQQIDEVLKCHFHFNRRERGAEIIAVLKRVGLPDPAHTAASYAHQLSGGMRQRAMIAMALVGKPRLLIADEPTTALDVTLQAQVLTLLKELQQEYGMSLLFITHDLGIVRQMAGRILVMHRGKLVEEAEASQFFKAPQHDYSKRLLEAVPRLVPQPAVEKTTKTLLNATNLKTYFPIRKGVFRRIRGYVKAVDDVSLTIEAGKTLALVGESGSGKTTVGLSLLQLYHLTDGAIFFNDRDITKVSSSQLKKLRRDMQIVFQDPFASMNPRMLVGDIIAESMQSQRLYTHKERQERVARLLERVGLEPSFKDRYPHEFSGGQRQRICIARALVMDPQFIILDEPTSALDVTIQVQILGLLKQLQDELGVAYLLITHNVGVVNTLAHDVAVMYRGKIVEEGTTNDVLFHPQHDYTKRLLAAVPMIM